jgi:ubiquinone/menaquinone biosynthesis C-methylase UbiE
MTSSYLIKKKITKDFGNEWETYNHSQINYQKLKDSYNQYFSIFPTKHLKQSEGFDMGCGSGRWAKILATKVKKLNCIDGSRKALAVAKKNLRNYKNIKYFYSLIKHNILKKNSQDFGYCLGVLHHTPDPLYGLKVCHRILKKNSPFLLYLYYDFENRPAWYKFIWILTNLLRNIISKLPFIIKKKVTFLIALLIYFPLAKISFCLKKIGFNTNNFPLSDYENKNFYIMKTDALDRFGTKLEKRFSKRNIILMLETAGFYKIKFSDKMPYWVVIAYKK